VENKHFGSTVNVSGLLTAKDIIDTLQAMPEGDKRQALIIPEPALRAGEDIFLDDMSLQEFAAHFRDIRVEPVQGGADYYHALTDWSNYHKNRSGETAYTWQSNAGYTKPVE
jgi:NifB/MoaA-like Fe-S oxidoreductase